MRNILIAAMALGIGGAETHIVELTRELRRRGNRVTVVSAGGVYVADILDAGAAHYDAPLDSRSPLKMLRAFFALRRVIAEVKPDVVHAHARIPSFLCGFARHFTAQRFAFVTTAHWVFKVTPLTRKLSNWGQRSLAVSDDVRRYLIENYGYPERDITVTVNGIDTEKFTPNASGDAVRAEFGIPDNAPVVLTISRLDATAGESAARLIDIAPELIARVKNIRIVITGADVTGSGFADALRARADAVNADAGYDAVIMTGARRDINATLVACDLFVGVSRAALEALATGKPTILAGGEGRLGLFCDAVRDAAIESNLTCRGYELPDAEWLTGEILRFFGGVSDEERRALGEYGCAFVRGNFSVTRMADDAERCYESALRSLVRVAMCGYYGHENAGDEAVMRCVKASVEAVGARDITVLSRSPRETRRRYGVAAAGRFNPFAIWRTLRRSDVLVFGGGSLLQDATSTRSLLYYLQILGLAHLFKCRVMIYANGIGPLTHAKNRARVARAVLRADAVTVRDVESMNELIDLGVPRDRLEVTADPVLLSEIPDAETLNTLRSNVLGDTERYVVFAVRQSSERVYGEFARLADGISDALDCDIVFLPMQPQNDEIASRLIAERMEHDARIVTGTQDFAAILAVLSGAETVVSMRLHTMVFAAIVGVPSAGIEVDPKIRAFL
ncbi:MAG: polysaccharide pyruvyl transferase CsaB, partial [Oscillospiraceae bacterium]|nr:polysaccharide pyruvyl transferase CsaB [Oscillospiraceae bacterium]